MKKLFFLIVFVFSCSMAFAQQGHIVLYGVSLGESIDNFKDKIGDKLNNYAGIEGCHYHINPYGASSVIRNIEISTPRGTGSIMDASRIVEIMFAKYGAPTYQYHQQTDLRDDNKCYDYYEWVLPLGRITVQTINISNWRDNDGHVVINYYDKANTAKAYSEHLKNM